MIRTLMAEANPVARLGIRSVLGKRAGSLEIDEACSQVELLECLDRRYYELIIVEPTMQGNGTELVARLRQASPWSDILVYTALDELSFGVEAIRHGAKGYLMKNASADEFRSAVKRVAGGKLYFSQALAAEFARQTRKYDARHQPHESFGQRESQVFALAACGLTPIETAQILQVSTETVGRFRSAVLARLRLTAPHQMAEYASAHGLLWDCRAACNALWAARYGQPAEVAWPRRSAAAVWPFKPPPRPGRPAAPPVRPPASVSR